MIGGWVTPPERLWLRHRLRSGVWAMAVVACLVVAGALASQGEGALAVAGLVLALVCLGFASSDGRLARRARIGIRSERIVRAALKGLESQGWALRHSVRWPDGGDIDHVATAPSGLAFTIETKTRSYGFEHLQRTRACAEWVGRKWRSPGGAYAVLCVTRGPSRCDVDHGVIVCSVDRLAGALVSTATSGVPITARRPGSVLALIGRSIGA